MATSKTKQKATARLQHAPGGKAKARPAKPTRSRSAAASHRPTAASKAASTAAARKPVKKVARKPAAKSAGKARAAKAAPARPSTLSSTRLRGRSPGAARSRTGKVAKSNMAIAKTRSSKTSRTGGGTKSKPAAKPAKASKPSSAAKGAAKSVKGAAGVAKSAKSAKSAAGAAKGAKPAKGHGAKAKPSPIAVARTARATGKFKLPHIDERTLKKIVAKLEEMREESLNIVNQNMQTDLKPREEASDVGDDLDQASSERDREFNLIMHQRHLRRLQQVEEAFERIEDGTYGLCEGTEEPINPKRLLIMPLARYSLEYQEQQEKTLGRAIEAEGYVEGEESFTAEE